MSSSAAVNVYMARQPIYDRAMKVYAYELLYRRSAEDEAAGVCGRDGLTAMVNTIIDIGLGQLLGDRRGFVNVSEEVLQSGCVELLPRDRVVIELLENIPPSEQNLAAVKSLKQAGYVIALDDFVPDGPAEAFVPYADIAKIDVIGTPPHFIRPAIRKMLSRNLSLLAEKVETPDMFKICSDLGFSHFQGYFFAKPALVSGRVITPNRTGLLRVVSALQDPEISYVELERLISRDVALSYRLLKLMGSAFVGAARVESIQQAIMFLGTRRVTAIATLLAMASTSDKPSELLMTAMVRAKSCEELARAMGYHPSETYFTLGLLSVLDALLDAPMAEVVKQLPLAPEIAGALVNPNADTREAAALRWVLEFERGNWDALHVEPGVGPNLAPIYVQSVNWATETARTMVA